MTPGAATRLFISYAHKDGANLAQRLLNDLAARGFDPWLDTQRLHGGATWTTEIENALDAADVILALLSPASYTSEICRAEQLRSLRKNKCVIPLRVQAGTDIPIHLEPKQYLDFSSIETYSSRLETLINEIGARSGVILKEEYRETYVTADPLPFNYIERPEAMESLRDAIIADGAGQHVALTALEGMGGIGKTVLAQALCYDEIVQHAFPDGIVWVTIGKESQDGIVPRMREIAKVLKDDLTRYDTPRASINQYRTTLRKKAALIVLDDVWDARDVEPFRADSPRSRLLFTTRDASIAAATGAREVRADLLTETQARNFLAQSTGIIESKLTRRADEIIRECGRLPSALAMIGAVLRNKPPAFWDGILDLLRRTDFERIESQFPNIPHHKLFRAIEVSVDHLDPISRDRYIALAVLLEDSFASLPVLQTLWKADEFEALACAEYFVSRSLATRQDESGAIRLHDLQLDYIRARSPLLNVLALIHGAFRLSAHVVARDPGQFAAQLTGRLLPFRDQALVGGFLTALGEAAPRPWLCPLRLAITPAGGALTRTLEGHLGTVNAVAIWADGRKAVSASDDRTLKLWDLETGGETGILAGHFGVVNSLAVSDDGRRAISASDDRTLKVWDLLTCRESHWLQGHTRAVSGVAMSADGKFAVSASNDKTLKLWDLEEGRELRTLAGHKDAVNGVAISVDGRLAVSASHDRTLKVWDLQTGREVRTLAGHDNSVSAVAIAADSRTAFSVSNNRTLKLWDLETGRIIRAWEGHHDSITGAAISADGLRGVTSSDDRTLKVWDLETGRELRTFEGHSGPVLGVALTRDGHTAVSASWDRSLKIWSLDSCADIPALNAHTRPVYGVAVGADGRRTVSASWDMTLKVWDLEGDRELATLQGHTASVMGVAVTADGGRAVSASWDSTLKVWDLESSQEIYTLRGHSRPVTSVAVTADGGVAVSSSDDGTLKVWDLETGQELRTLAGSGRCVDAVAISPDGRIAISAADDATLKVWNLNIGAEVATLEGHEGPAKSVAISADGRRAVSGSNDRTLKLWDLEKRSELRTFKGHTHSVRSVAISPDGSLAVSTSNDSTLKLWDLESGKILASFNCDSAPQSCAFCGNRNIVAGDALGRIHYLRIMFR